MATVARELADAARNLRVDAVTAEIVGALKTAGVRPILLKGPAVARWLYPDRVRAYGDTDLLVAPAELARAERTLRLAGFAPFLPDVELEGERRLPALAWIRRADRATVDLHGSLAGVGAEPEAAWRVLAADTETIVVGASPVEVLGLPARALHVVLHAAQHGRDEAKPLADLERALARLDRSVWEDAAALATRLDAAAALAAGLRLAWSGVVVADALALPDAPSVEIALRARSAPAAAFTFERLTAARGTWAKARVVLRAVAPPPAHMRAFVPIARRGPAGLVAAYPWRGLRKAVTFAAALAAWRQARREAR